jgi:hypothetical protein
MFNFLAVVFRCFNALYTIPICYLSPILLHVLLDAKNWKKRTLSFLLHKRMDSARSPFGNSRDILGQFLFLL